MTTSRNLATVIVLMTITLLLAGCPADEKPLATEVAVAPTEPEATQVATEAPTPTPTMPSTDTPAHLTDTAVRPTETLEAEISLNSLSVAEILKRARTAEEAIHSARIRLEQEVVVPGGSIILTCDGVLEQPARLYMACDAAGTPFEMVVLSEIEAFMRQHGDELWVRMPAEAVENPLEQTGLGKFGDEAQVVGQETIDNVASYVVESAVDLGTLLGSDPQVLQAFSLQDSSASIKGWIGKDDFLPRRYEVSMILSGPGGEIQSDVSVDQDSFDEPVTIPEPAPYATQLSMATSDPVLDIAFSPDGQTLAVCDDDAFLYLWQTKDPQIYGRYLDHPELLNKGDDAPYFLAADFYSLSFSPDNRTLAAGTLGEALLYDLTDLEAEPLSLAVTDEVHVQAIAYSSDNRTVAAGGDDGLVYLWDTANPEAVPIVLEGHEAPIRDLLFMPDGTTLITGSEDSTLHVWDMNDLAARPRVLAGHDMPVYDIAITADGDTLFSVGFKDPVFAWVLDTPGARPDPIIPAEDPGIGKYPTLALALSPDGKLLATSEVFGTVRLWAAPEFDQPIATFSTGNQYDIMNVDFSPDGRYLAASQSNLVHIWDLAPETPDEAAATATEVDGMTATELLARNQEAMAELQTLTVSMTVDNDDRDSAGEMEAGPTRIITITADLRLPSDLHGWWNTSNETWEMLQLDGGPTVVRSNPDDKWQSRVPSLAQGLPSAKSLLALSTPETLARAARFEEMENAGSDDPYLIAFAVHPREFFALEPTLDERILGTRTQVTGKAWIERENLLTQRVQYEISLKTPYVDWTITYVLEFGAFDAPVQIPVLEQ